MNQLARKISPLTAYLLECFGTADLDEVIGLYLATVTNLRTMLLLTPSSVEERAIKLAIHSLQVEEREVIYRPKECCTDRCQQCA